MCIVLTAFLIVADFIKTILGENWQSIDSDSLSSTSDDESTRGTSISPVSEHQRLKKSVTQRSAVTANGDRSLTSSPITSNEEDSVQTALLKRLYVVEELRETEKEYVEKLDYVLKVRDGRHCVSVSHQFP